MIDGVLLVNEFVMWLYNFGYWIIDGVCISQFEQYLCVVLDYLFGDSDVVVFVMVMVNVFGVVQLLVMSVDEWLYYLFV